ncbi:hypothetical protein [Intestinibacter sp.]
MARKPSYTKRDLTVACSKIKTSIKKRIASSELELKSVTKNLVYADLAKRLKLSGTSAFWKPTYPHKEYLDNWYNELVKSIEQDMPANTVSQKVTLDTANANKIPQDIINKINEQKEMIEHLNKIIVNLRIENESLRLSRLHRLKKIDSSIEILNESIDDVELNNLYKVICDLYKSRFPEK